MLRAQNILFLFSDTRLYKNSAKVKIRISYRYHLFFPSTHAILSWDLKALQKERFAPAKVFETRTQQHCSIKKVSRSRHLLQQLLRTGGFGVIHNATHKNHVLKTFQGTVVGTTLFTPAFTFYHNNFELPQIVCFHMRFQKKSWYWQLKGVYPWKRSSRSRTFSRWDKYTVSLYYFKGWLKEIQQLPDSLSTGGNRC